MSILLSVVEIMLLFGLTVFVHEFGHFLVARWLGLVVDVFSIGFGPAIWKKRVGQIEYRVGCIPFGGYVALPQMEPGGAKNEEGESRDLPRIAAWKKIPVALAGAFCNILLAIALATVVYYASSPEQRAELPAVIGYVSDEGAAHDAGLQPGDTIVDVNGKEVSSWNEFMLECAFEEQADMLVRAADGTERQVVLETEKSALGGRWVPGMAGPSRCAVLGVRSGSSAEKAGLQANDVLISFNNQELYSRAQLIAAVDLARDQKVPITVLRGEETLNLEVTPRYDEELDRALIGIEFNHFDTFQPPLAQLKEWAAPVFMILKALVTPSTSGEAAASVGGPVMIFQMFWYAVRSSLLLALWFTGMINVNLAIINLLPIPVLDGGHIVFATIEWVAPRALPEKIHAWALRVFAILLIATFGLITVRDIGRIFFKGHPAGTVVETNAVPAEVDIQE